VYKQPLTKVLTLAWNDDRYTHLLLIPAISIVLIFSRRRSIFQDIATRPLLGILIGSFGTVLGGLALAQGPMSEGTLSLAISGLVVTWVGAFIGLYGVRPSWAALFPLTCLLLFIPLPPLLVEFAQVALQQASADVTYLLFRLTGTPVFRQGLVFSLPGIDIEVARECSGIRSTIALLITALVLSYLFLRSGWHKVSFVLLTIPVAIFKNALRIATLSWLGVYVSKDYLLGRVHHYSGLPVSALGFGLMIPTLLLLQRLERRRPARPTETTRFPPSSPDPSLPATD